jgi:hypothetical protein
MSPTSNPTGTLTSRVPNRSARAAAVRAEPPDRIGAGLHAYGHGLLVQAHVHVTDLNIANPNASPSTFAIAREHHSTVITFGLGLAQRPTGIAGSSR